MAIARQFFCKEERLSSRKSIQRLFARKGTASHLHFPLVGVWFYGNSNGKYSAQVLFSVSKKNFKHATCRNRIKRQMREAYRLEKTELYAKLQSHEQHCTLALLYIAKEKLPYAKIYEACSSILAKVATGAEKGS